MTTPGQLECRIHSGVGDIEPGVWDGFFPGDVERHAYYRAAEAAPPPAFRLGAISVRRDGVTVAVAPTFAMSYRLDTPLQGRWRPLGDWLHRRLPNVVNQRIIGLGSPLVDRCHLGVAPRLASGDATSAVACLLDGLARHAGETGANVLAVKDIAGAEAGRAHAALTAAGYTRVASLPVAMLDLGLASEAEYLASLSSATRKDIRRKLKSIDGVEIEHTREVESLLPELIALYRETLAVSGVDYGDFEELSPAYFSGLVREMGEDVVFVLYRIGGTLAAFNMLIVRGERAIDKVLGMHYPVAREHNLYAVSWMTNVRYCLARGVRSLETGRTAYTSKVRYGSRLEPCFVYFRHARRGVNRLFKTFGPLLAFDKLDPELKALARRAKR